MSKHTDNATQSLEMYGTTVYFRQVAGFEIEVSFMGGTWPNGDEVKRFPNMAEALAEVAEIAADLEEEEGDDWGIED